MPLAAALNQAEIYWFGFVPLGELVRLYVKIVNEIPRVRVEKFNISVKKRDHVPFIRTKYNT